MARRRNRFATFLALSVFALAAYGAYTIWQKKDTQKTVKKVERSVKAAQKAW